VGGALYLTGDEESASETGEEWETAVVVFFFGCRFIRFFMLLSLSQLQLTYARCIPDPRPSSTIPPNTKSNVSSTWKSYVAPPNSLFIGKVTPPKNALGNLSATSPTALS
jgi:hypothetical protein